MKQRVIFSTPFTKDNNNAHDNINIANTNNIKRNESCELSVNGGRGVAVVVQHSTSNLFVFDLENDEDNDEDDDDDDELDLVEKSTSSNENEK